MNVDTMRRIDHLAGVPLCAIATLLRALARLASSRRRPLRRMLFIELSEMGTTLLAEPAMRKARTALSAELFFVIFERNVGSLELLGTFPPENVFTISDKSLFALARDTLAFLRWCRRKQIDTVRRSGIVLALYRAVERLIGRRPARRLSSLSQRRTLPRRDADASCRL